MNLRISGPRHMYLRKGLRAGLGLLNQRTMLPRVPVHGRTHLLEGILAEEIPPTDIQLRFYNDLKTGRPNLLISQSLRLSSSTQGITRNPFVRNLFSRLPPDATIYPDPSETSSEHHRFLCRNCFIKNGGSKGTCPQCTRPVLILKSEGGFVYASGRHWHKKCFNCDGCGKNFGDKPLVDLLGRPSCADCFDNCLNRTPSTPKERTALPVDTTSANPGGMMRTPKDERVSSGSPTIDELEQRLGIVKSRESSPALEELGQRLSMLSKGRESPTRSPLARKSTIPRNETWCPIAPSSRLGYGAETFNASGSPRMLPSDGSPSLSQRFSSPELGTIGITLLRCHLHEPTPALVQFDAPPLEIVQRQPKKQSRK
ncbi:lim-type zinc finger-containing protein [Salix suchowensis]|nr:lim-type zinc finger-containing protein [Salix suchowensis]